MIEIGRGTPAEIFPAISAVGILETVDRDFPDMGLPTDIFPDLMPSSMRNITRHYVAISHATESVVVPAAKSRWDRDERDNPYFDERDDHQQSAANLQHYDEGLSHSPSSDGITLHSRQDQLIEAAAAIGSYLRSYNPPPIQVQEGPNIWRIPGAQALFGFFTLAFAAAVMLSVLAYRNLNATEQVVALMAKVENVGGLEKRLAEKLEQSNIGVQALINETNNRISFLQGQVTSMPTDTRQIVSELDSIAKTLMAIPNQLATVQTLQADDNAGPAAAQPVRKSAPKPKRISVAEATNVAAALPVKPMPRASRAFRRVVGEDGSIRFEKVR